MSGSIQLTGLALNDPRPGNYLEILFGQGPSAGFAGQRSILLIGNATSAGNAVRDTVVYGPDTSTPAVTEQDIINLTGTGSPLHRAWLQASPIAGNTSSIYFVAVTSSGGTAASKTFTLANVPTSSGTVRIWVGPEFVDTTFASGDTLATITAAIVSNINAKTRWAVTAAQSTVSTSNDSVAITAKVPGPRGNWIRAMAAVGFANGATPNTTITGTTDAFLTSGATADSNANALATILSTRYYYIVSEAEDSTQFGALVTQVNMQALPTNGIRQRCFCGSVDTQSAVDTIAVAQNAARAEFIWQKAGVLTPFEMAAKAAAIYAVEENSGGKPKCNFSFYPRNDSESANWGQWPAPRDQSSWPTPTVIKTALLNGVTPIGVRPNGSTYLVKRITSRSLNGSNADYRIRDAHKVTIPDFYGDDLIEKENAQLGGKNLTDDVKVGDPNQPPSDTTTPNRYRDLINGLTNQYGANFLLQKIDVTKSDMIVQRETGDPTRLSASIPLYPIDILDKTAAVISQVG